MPTTANRQPTIDRRVLVLGGGDVGSAIAHRLFCSGWRVLIADRPQSPHIRRGMAFTDALFDGTTTLAGVEARWLSDLAGVEACWQGIAAVPVVTMSESLVATTIRFDVIIEATMRRNRVPPDLRAQAELFVGLGPGYVPGQNCHVAIETQWGPSMGSVLHDRPTAERSGGPHALAGVTRERFAIAPCAGVFRTAAALGQDVQSGDPLGQLHEHVVRAPIAGKLRGLTRDGVEVQPGQRLVEVDPRSEPEIAGLGERPLAIAQGVESALNDLRKALPGRSL
jgi:xanthine dehydrogenase accessory factor